MRNDYIIMATKNKLQFLGLDFTGKSDLSLQGVSGENNHSELDYTHMGRCCDIWHIKSRRGAG